MKRLNDCLKHRGNCTGQIRYYGDTAKRATVTKTLRERTSRQDMTGSCHAAREPLNSHGSAMIVCTAVRAADYELLLSIEQPVEGS